MSTLNIQERVKLVTAALGVQAETEVYQALGGVYELPVTFTEPVSNIEECKALLWKTERNTSQRFALIKMIEEFLLQRGYYLPRMLN